MDLSDSLHSTSVAKTLQVPVDKVSQNLFESLTHIQTVSSFSSSKLSTVSAVLNLMARSLDEAFCEEKNERQLFSHKPKSLRSWDKNSHPVYRPIYFIGLIIDAIK